MSINTCWELAQQWYTGRMEIDWKRPDKDQTQAIFHSLFLDGPFWDLG